MCPAHGAGGGIALLDEAIEQLTLVVTQLHDIFLGHGSLLPEVSVPKNVHQRNRCNRLLVRGVKSETVQFNAVESVLDRSSVAPKREIHSSHTVDVEKREIHIHIDAAMLAQLRQGYIEEEPEDMIDVTPQAWRPMREVMSELEAATGADHG
jgi:hypothetical protein